jgi:Inorganic Pyrophosphatase
MSTAVQEAAAGIDPANNWPLPGAPTDRELVPPAAPPNAAQQALINTGKRIRGAAESAIPMTPQEQASGGAAVGGVIGGALPYVLAGAVDPGLGLIAGAGGMSLTSAGQTYEAAKAKGASDGDAAEAAGISGVIGGALGILPLGAVMKPIEQASPGIKGYVAAKLAQAGISGTTFATIGEAQEYLTQQIAKHYYDPQAGYSPDATRAIANFVGGGALGSMHPLEARIQRSTPEQIAEFLRRHREWMDRQPRQVDGPEPTEGEIVPERRGLPGPDTGAAPPEPTGPEAGPRPTGSGEAATPPKTDHQTLLDEGFNEKEIADMSPRVRAQRLETAKSGNPISDGQQIRDVEDKSGFPIKGAESAPDALAAGARRAAERAPGRRDARIVATTVDDALKAPEVVKENRTPAQAAGGNTQLGHLEILHLGLKGKYGITIETGVGQTRTSKVDAEGKPSREVQMPVAWGRTKGIGNDGDHLDVFVGPRLQSPHVFIINQRDPASDKLDGHKVLAGFDDRKTAVRAYPDSFPNNAMPHIGNVIAMTPVQFQDWLKHRDHGEHLENPREESGQEEVTAAHHAAIEDVLGPMADKVQPVHIARAAELLADHPDMPPGLAFQHAVTENAVNKGDLTVAAAEDASGPEVKETLGSQRESAPSGGLRADNGRAKPRAKRTGAHLHGVKAGGSTPPLSQEAPARAMPLTNHGAAKRAELERLLTEAVHKMVPSVKIKFHEGRIDHVDQGGWGDVAAKYKGVVGLYRPAKQLIELSLESGNPVSTAFHEAYHAIEHLLQTARERALMMKETPRLRRAIDNGLVGFDKTTIAGMAGYEVRAVAFEIYRHQRDKFGKAQNLHVGVRRWYHRLTELTNRIRNGVNGLGFQTAEDIFAKAYEGGFAGRSPPLGTSPQQDEALASVRNPFNGPLRDSLGEKMDEVLASKTNKALEGYHDLSRSVRVLQDNIEARLAGELPDSQAMYTKKRLFPGKVGADVQDFNKDHLDPLFAMLKARGLTLEQAGDLVYAMHAGERNREMDKINMEDMHRPAADQVLGRGSGLSNSEAQKIFDQYPQALRNDVARRIKGIRDFINRTMVKDGLETQATIDGWNATYKNYVPLSGWEDAPEDAPSGSGGRFNVRGPEVRSAFGRTSKANNPLVNLIDQAYRTIERARKNEYLLSVDNALHELEEDDLKNFVRFNKGVPKKALDKRTGLVKVVEDSNYRNDPGAVAFKRAGQTRYMIFENKQLADAIKNMHADGLDWAQPLLNFQNKLKSLWTHYSPDFLIRHFLFRYPVEGFLNSFEQGASNAPRYMAESFPFFGDASRAIFASNKGTTHVNPRIREMQQYWEEMRRAGGSMTFRSMRDTDLLREHLNNAITSLSKNPLRTVQNKAHAFSEAMDIVTNALDNALRLAAFAAARRQGKTPEQSALLARGNG